MNFMIKEDVLDYIKEKYDINPEYLFSQFPSYFVFRNKKNWISYRTFRKY